MEKFHQVFFNLEMLDFYLNWGFGVSKFYGFRSKK